MGDAVLAVHRDGRIILKNQAFVRLHEDGTDPGPVEDWARKYRVYLPGGRDLCPTEHLPIVRAMGGESCDDVELVIVSPRHPEGIPVSVTGRPLLGQDGVSGGVIVIRDISARKRSELAYQTTAERLKISLANAQLGLWDWDIASGKTFLDDRWQAMLGYEPGELPQHVSTWEKTLHPDDLPHVMDVLHRHLASDDSLYDVEYRARTKSGDWRWVNARGRVQERSPQGTALRMTGTVQDVTDRKRVEESLREEESRFRNAFDSAPIGMALVSTVGRWLRVNRRICEMLGYSETELLATDFQTVTHPEDLDADLQLVHKVLEGSIPSYQMEKRYFHKTGPIIPVLLTVSLVRDAHGVPVHFISQIKDIRLQKEAELALRANDALLRQFIRHTPAAIAILDSAMCYLQVSDRWRKDYHLDGQDLIGRCHYDVFPDLPERWKEIHRRVLTGSVESCEEDAFPRADGGMEWLQWEARPWKGTDGRIGGVIFFTQVITSRKLSELALRKSEERFRILFEQSSDAHLIFDHVNGIIDCNNATLDMLRCRDKREILKLHPAMLSPEFQADGRRSIEKAVDMDATARRHGYHRFDWLHRRFDGDVFPCEVTLTPVELNGRPALLVVWHDLTERNRAADALRASEERYRSVVESLAEGIVVQDASGQILTSNDRASAILGLSRDQIAGRTSVDPRWQAVHDDGSPFPGEEHPSMVALRTERPVFNVIMGVRKPDGQTSWLTVNAVPVMNPAAGGVGSVVASFHDITESRRLHQTVRASLEEKEVLLREIHHRVKNNLQIVSALLDLQSDYTDDPKARQMFLESQARVRSMALIHERLYRSDDMARVDFPEYLRRLTDELYQTNKISDNEVRLELSVDVPSLTIDVAIPCGLILNELISNCFKHAFADGRTGSIRITMGPAGAPGKSADDAEELLLTLADDGAGFPPGTDFRNSGTFGLQLVNTLVKQLRGTIEVASPSSPLSVGGGTMFAIRFPIDRTDLEPQGVRP
jgi:PAS domain S-box-containing protein